jgi:pyruvate kinase
MLEALDNLVEIIEVSDAVMVARGDLAIEVGAAQLPQMQKRIIALCNQIGRPVITATQMLDSMVTSPTPTRAEITDVANAVLDGSDALMLSAETASGKHPFKCISTMHEIICEVERTGHFYYDISLDEEHMPVAETIGAGASLIALKLNSPVIVCLSTTGKTAVQISKFRPKAQILACTNKLDTLHRLELVWGIQTLVIKAYEGSDDVIHELESLLVEYGLAKVGDHIVMTLGMPVSRGSTTNSIRVFQIGKKESASNAKEIPFRYKN